MADSNVVQCQKKIDPHFGTKAIHVGQNPDQWSFKDVVPPISLTTTYKQYGPNDHAVSFSFNLDKQSATGPQLFRFLRVNCSLQATAQN